MEGYSPLKISELESRRIEIGTETVNTHIK